MPTVRVNDSLDDALSELYQATKKDIGKYTLNQSFISPSEQRHLVKHKKANRLARDKKRREKRLYK